VPCYSPQEYQVTHGVAPLLRRGINGRGETVVVGAEPAAGPSPHGPAGIRKDLAYFDKMFAMPPAVLPGRPHPGPRHPRRPGRVRQPRSRHRHGDGGQLRPALPGLGTSSSAPVVYVGYTAGPGWDPVTGLGSPDAQYLVPLLAAPPADQGTK
jgi:hypothetical protein